MNKYNTFETENVIIEIFETSTETEVYITDKSTGNPIENYIVKKVLQK